MTIHVEAVYEHGVLRPRTPLALSEGQRVHVLVVSEEASVGQNAASILAAIGALPVETPAEPSASRDHDRVLYLAAKANEGELSAEERDEYEDYIEAVDDVAIRQSQASSVAAEHPSI
jgi:predicted DNA-binding antitoxin AbrB/MazE fold protein